MPYDPIVSNVSQALMPPSAAHIAGTDQLGRDVFSRLIVAARLDLAIAISAVRISFAIGAVIGAICGYTGGRLDRGVGRFVDVVMAFPLFVLAMAMVAALGNRVENIIATAIINLPFYIRFARAEVNVRRNLGWVEAARAAATATSRSCCASCCRTCCRPWRCKYRSISAGRSSTLRDFPYRSRRQAADAGMGHHGCGGRALHFHRQMVAGRLSGPGADADGAVLQPARRRGARYSSTPACEHDQIAAGTKRPARHLLDTAWPCRGGAGVTLSLGEGEMLGLVGEEVEQVRHRLCDHAAARCGRADHGRRHPVSRAGHHADIGGDFRHLHGAAMAMIFQNPRAALNPIRAVGDQIADAITAHKRMPRDEARAQALELLRAKIRDPEKRMAAYPHELSGGMCQRVMIAMAISCNPALLIADEPTTGLDVTTQKVVMDLLTGIAAERGMATILITHDLGLAAATVAASW